MEFLFSFLEKEKLNETLAGYFAKVVNILLTKKLKDVMDFLFTNVNIFSLMLKHVYSTSISEIL